MAGSRAILDFLFSRTSTGSVPYGCSEEDAARQTQDTGSDYQQIWEFVQSATMTSRERIVALCDAAHYIVDSEIPGDVVECGVWKGGSMMAAAKALIDSGRTDRRLWLFDTFSGMNSPTGKDVDYLGKAAAELLQEHDPEQSDSVWCRAAIEEVHQNIESTGYPMSRAKFIAGEVESTLAIEKNRPQQIAILRLDTDWYESTKVALEQLYPRLQPGGVLIIDDYGHWQGCRDAVDEYFARCDEKLFFNRIDYTGRLAIKPGSKQLQVTRAH